MPLRRELFLCRLWTLAVLVTWLAAASLVSAQAPNEITAGSVQAMLDKVKGDTAIKPELRERLVGTYQQALGQLKAADQSSTLTAQFAQAAAETQKALKEAGQQLERPVSEATPRVKSDVTAEFLAGEKRDAEADVAAITKQIEDFNAQANADPQQRAKLNEAVAAAEKRIEEANASLAGTPVPGQAPEVIAAERILTEANKKAATEEARALRAEVALLDARRDAFAKLMELYNRRLKNAQGLADFWTRKMNDEMMSAAMGDQSEALRTSATLRNAHPEIRKMAMENLAFITPRLGDDGVLAKLRDTVQESEITAAQEKEISDNQRKVKEQISIAGGVTPSIAIQLLGYQQDQPDLQAIRSSLKTIPDESSRIQLELIDNTDKMIRDPKSFAERMLTKMGIPRDSPQRDDYRQAIMGLARNRNRYIDNLGKDDRGYLNALVQLSTEKQKLLKSSESFSQFIARNVMWIRTRAFHPGDVRRLWDSLAWLGTPGNWKQIPQAMWSDLRANPLIYLLILLLILPLLNYPKRLGQRIKETGEKIAAAGKGQFVLTLEALALSLINAALWPLFVLFIAWRLSLSSGSSALAASLAGGLQIAALVFLTMQVFRQVCLPKGLGEAHFGWPAEYLDAVRWALWWLTIVLLPVVFTVSALEWEGGYVVKEIPARAVLAVGLLALALILERAGGKVWRVTPPSGQTGLIRFYRYWLPPAVALPVILALLVFFGYYYAALQMSWRLLATAWLILGLLVLQALILRWLQVARRKLALHRATTDAPVSEQKQEIDIPLINMQTRRLVQSLIVFSFLVGLWLIWIKVLPALQVLDRQLWTTTRTSVAVSVPLAPGITSAAGEAVKAGDGTIPIKVSNVLFAIAIIALTIMAGRNIPGLLEVSLLQKLPLDAGARYAIDALARYVIYFAGISIAFGSIGIGWEKIQWLVAAITVGLGFGMQEIFANFVSGLIILFERPVRVGDTITLGGVTGVVRRIQMRATTVTDADRKDLIVPNKQLITGQLVNWTLSNKHLGYTLPYCVIKGSDPERVREILVAAARKFPAVQKEPQPAANLIGFAAGNMNFELRVFLAMKESAKVLHDINRTVEEDLREAEISLA